MLLVFIHKDQSCVRILYTAFYSYFVLPWKYGMILHIMWPKMKFLSVCPTRVTGTQKTPKSKSATACNGESWILIIPQKRYD